MRSDFKIRNIYSIGYKKIEKIRTDYQENYKIQRDRNLKDIEDMKDLNSDRLINEAETGYSQIPDVDDNNNKHA